MNILRRYAYNTNELSERTGLAIEDNEENNRTKQEFAEEVDINTLLRRFNITGQLPQGVRLPTYEDFTEVYDFHSAANAIAQANEAFEAMPAEVRLRFENDPAKFLAFCDNPNNRQEAERLGLVDPRPKPPEPAPAAPPTPSIGETAPAEAGATGDTKSVT